MDTDAQDRVVQYMCKHLVAIGVNFVRAGREEMPPQFCAYSGTVAAFGDKIFLVTAGHVVRELNSVLRSDDIRSVEFSLIDCFGSTARFVQPIPFDFSSATKRFVDEGLDELPDSERRQVVDFGLIELRDLVVELLLRNGIKVIKRDHWESASAPRRFRYMLLGFPSCLVEDRDDESRDSGATRTLGPTMITFNRAEPDEVTSGATDERFVGIVDPMVDLPDITGMSGGPIFGFSIDPELRYWAVAIQGSWRRNERLLFGCRFASIENRLLSGGAT